jgi:nucleoside-diphosphate-sugar epimerase
MKILVTGGTGFLGKRLVQKLATKHKVTVFSRKRNDDFPKNVKMVNGDIRDKESLESAFMESKPDIVYHLAICLNESDPEMYEINAKGTKNVAELCKRNSIKQLIFMSSSGVLGETRIPSKEDFPYRPKTSYERSKVESEHWIKKSGVPYTIIRTTIIIGSNMIWAQIFEAARKGYPVIGSGKNYFHLVYVEDIVRMLLLAAGNSKAFNQTFHVASKDTPTYYEVYRMIAEELDVKMTDKKIPLHVAYAAAFMHKVKRRLQGKQPSLTKSKSSIDRLVRNRIISTDKAKKVLGFEPKYDTREAIRETIKYLKIAKLGYSDYDLVEVQRVKK